MFQKAIICRDLLNFILPLYTISSFCQPLSHYILEVFYNCCKLLVSKDLRRAGPAPPVLSRYHQRTYGDCLLQIVCQPYFSPPLRACGRDWSCLSAMTPRYQNVLPHSGFEPRSLLSIQPDSCHR